MTIDVQVNEYDDQFIENIEDIVEETLVGMFVLHPKDIQSLEDVQALSNQHPNIFYALPPKLLENRCEKCVAVVISSVEDLENLTDNVIMIEEKFLDKLMVKALQNSKGIILNATKNHENLENFFVSISPGSVDFYDKDQLNKLSMKKLALQSSYPQYEFDDVYTCVEKISHTMFRSEQSITLEATKNTLQLFNLMKG
jgi:hypothetical protein